MGESFLTLEIKNFYTTIPSVAQMDPDENSVPVKPVTVNGKDAYPVSFIMNHNEVTNVQFDYESEYSILGKSNSDASELKITGLIIDALTVNSFNMHLLRRWSKQKKSVGGNQLYNANDDFYKELTINCIYQGKDIRRITFKNAYLCKYTEFLSQDGSKYEFELIVKQRVDFRTDIDIFPFKTVYSQQTNETKPIPQSSSSSSSSASANQGSQTAQPAQNTVIAGQTQPAATAASSGNNASGDKPRKTSDNGIDFLHKYEGFSATVYTPANDGTDTIGYGTVIKDKKGNILIPVDEYNKYKAGGKMTDERASELFYKELTNVETLLNNFIDTHNIDMKQHHYDAMVSWSYNTGTQHFSIKSKYDSVIEIIRKTDILTTNDPATKLKFEKEMATWISSNNAVVKGLCNRRMDEINMFLNQQYVVNKSKTNAEVNEWLKKCGRSDRF